MGTNPEKWLFGKKGNPQLDLKDLLDIAREMKEDNTYQRSRLAHWYQGFLCILSNKRATFPSLEITDTEVLDPLAELQMRFDTIVQHEKITASLRMELVRRIEFHASSMDGQKETPLDAAR